MMNLSIIIPTIRPHFWERIYNSVSKSCKRYQWEIIFVGPFKNDELLNKHKNIKYISSYRCPSACFHEGVLNSSYSHLYFTSDDSVLYENALDTCIDEYIQKCRSQDVINCRYREGDGFAKEEFKMDYWLAKTYPNDYRLKFINPEWSLAIQTIVEKNFFVSFGGFDCQFEFSNHAHADFAFRLQNFGGSVHHSSCEIANLDHLNVYEGDHKPVHDAQLTHDLQIFFYIWNNHINRTAIDFNCTNKRCN